MIVLTLGPLLAGGIDLACVEAATFFGVAEQVIGGRDCLELGLLARVVWIEVRMQGLGELSVGLLDLVLRGCIRDAENLVGVVIHL